MEENNQNNENLHTEENTNKSNASFKNIDFKNEANTAKSFIPNFFKNPIKEIETIANAKNGFLVIAIIAFLIWIVATLIGEIIGVIQSYLTFSSFYMDFGTFLVKSVNNIFSVIKGVAGPILTVVALTLITFLMQNIMQKGNKKSFITIAVSVIIAKIPVVLSTIIGLISFIGGIVPKITSSVSGFCGVLSTVLLYFSLKSLYGEKEDNNFFKSFFIIMGIFYIVRLILSFPGIYI